jgi:tetratricopeptide (TPR) repeat protein
MLLSAAERFEKLGRSANVRNALFMLTSVHQQAANLDNWHTVLDRIGSLSGCAPTEQLLAGYVDLAATHWNDGDHDKAVELYGKALTAATAVTPSQNVARLSALAHRMTGTHFIERAAKNPADYAKACTHFEECLRIFPDGPERHEDLFLWATALTYQAADAPDLEADSLLRRACAMYDLAHELKPDNWGVLDLHGVALHDRASLVEGEEADELYLAAVEKFEAALKLETDCFEANYHLGVTLSAQARRHDGTRADGLRRRACDALASAFRARCDDTATVQAWATTLIERATAAPLDSRGLLFADVFEKLETLQQANPDDPEILIQWAWALLEQADGGSDGADEHLAAAESKFEAALVMKGDHAEALYGLGRVLLERARREPTGAELLLGGAKERMMAADAIHPSLGAYGLACVHSRLGNEQDCRKMLEKVRDAGRLASREDASADPDLAPIADRDWFWALFEVGQSR